MLTSRRAFSNFGLLSSTLSLDCCFNLRKIAVTEGPRIKTQHIKDGKVNGSSKHAALVRIRAVWPAQDLNSIERVCPVYSGAARDNYTAGDPVC